MVVMPGPPRSSTAAPRYDLPFTRTSPCASAGVSVTDSSGLDVQPRLARVKSLAETAACQVSPAGIIQRCEPSGPVTVSAAPPPTVADRAPTASPIRTWGSPPTSRGEPAVGTLDLGPDTQLPGPSSSSATPIRWSDRVSAAVIA